MLMGGTGDEAPKGVPFSCLYKFCAFPCSPLLREEEIFSWEELRRSYPRMNHKIFQECQREYDLQGPPGSGRGERLKLPQAEPGASPVWSQRVTWAHVRVDVFPSPSLSSGYRSPPRATHHMYPLLFSGQKNYLGIKHLDSTPNCSLTVILAKWIHLSELQFLHLSPKDTHIYS